MVPYQIVSVGLYCQQVRYPAVALTLSPCVSPICATFMGPLNKHWGGVAGERVLLTPTEHIILFT